mgnify:CR=1 FL=1
MALSRKYYQAIAQAIKESTMNKDREYLAPILNKMLLIDKLSSILKNDNNLFNANKFIDACGNSEVLKVWGLRKK